jgi:hypothetical protein
LPRYWAHGSGIFGLTGLLVWLLLWLRDLPVLDSDLPKLMMRQKSCFWLMILVSTIAVALVSLFSPMHYSETIQAIVVRGVVGAISGFCLGIGLYAIVFWGMRFGRKI